MKMTRRWLLRASTTAPPAQAASAYCRLCYNPELLPVVQSDIKMPRANGIDDASAAEHEDQGAPCLPQGMEHDWRTGGRSAG